MKRRTSKIFGAFEAIVRSLTCKHSWRKLKTPKRALYARKCRKCGIRETTYPPVL